MKRLTIKLILGLLLSLLSTPSLSNSNIEKGYRMIEQNSTLEPFTLNDQFGEEHKIDTLPKIVVCSFGKTSGQLISSYFQAQEENYLTKNSILLLADVSGVPSLLRKTIIFPKMKKNRFQILTITDKEFAKQFPKEEDKLTLLKLDNGVVSTLSFAKDDVELKAFIEN